MVKRRPKNTTRSTILRRRRQRIIIPQPVERPLQLHARDVLKGEVIAPADDFFTLHRRGLRREQVGQDPLEARAIPHSQRRGSLPERIVLKYLLDVFHFQEPDDFSFQAAFEGGRAELGGLDADFLFPRLFLIIEVQGPTHTHFLQQRKDEERRDTMAEFGYTVEELWERDIYDEQRLENKMRRIFGLAAGKRGAGADTFSGRLDGDPDVWNDILKQIQGAESALSVLLYA